MERANLPRVGVPHGLRAELAARLEPGEVLLAWLVPDLDAQLCYVESLVVLTDRRVLSIEPSGAAAAESPSVPSSRWKSWPLDLESTLRIRERAGLGTLELSTPAGLSACWRYTAARSIDAQLLVREWRAYRSGELGDSSGLDAAEILDARSDAQRPNAASLLRLMKFARLRAAIILVGFALTLTATAVGLLPTYLTQPLVDEVLSPYQAQVDAINARTDLDARVKQAELAELQRDQRSRMGVVGWYLAGIAGTALVGWLLGWTQGVVMASVSENISADLRNRTYAHLHSLSLEFFGGRRTGELMSRISSDTDRICTFLADHLVDFATDVLMIVMTAVVLFWYDPPLAIASLLPFPLIAWMIVRVRNQLQQGFARGGRAWADMTSVLADTIPGIRVVKAFAQERHEVDRFRRANQRVLEANGRVNTLWAFFWPLVVLLNQFGLLAVWAFGAWRVYDQRITVGVLVMFLLFIGRFYTRLESMSRMLSATQRAATSAQRIFEILDRVPSVAEPLDPVKLASVQGEVDIRNVGFRYGNRPVIEGVNLSIRPGEMIGLVGASGAGKSTLVNLVCRFYDVAEGAILVDGVDIRSFEIAEYRRHIGVVLQDPFLFYGTIAENIAYGRPVATRDEITSAARAARAHDFILRLPDGYDTIVGERGQLLSGGERQRISIARALLIDPAILILDEATSSVDTETEREIQQALENLIEGRTTIAIAHRLSTLRRADRLVVLQHGRIVEVGRHEELIGTAGVYAQLHNAQAELAHGVP